MSTMTTRLPEDTARRLKRLARSRGLSLNKLIEELSIQALAVSDTETRFRVMAAQGSVERGLAVLDRLDAADRAAADADSSVRLAVPQGRRAL